jgi:hypothetical protein
MSDLTTWLIAAAIVGVVIAGIYVMIEPQPALLRFLRA